MGQPELLMPPVRSTVRAARAQNWSLGNPRTPGRAAAAVQACSSAVNDSPCAVTFAPPFHVRCVSRVLRVGASTTEALKSYSFNLQIWTCHPRVKCRPVRLHVTHDTPIAAWGPCGVPSGRSSPPPLRYRNLVLRSPRTDPRRPPWTARTQSPRQSQCPGSPPPCAPSRGCLRPCLT